MIFGHTRYSVFSPDGGSWRAAKFLSPENYKDFLFSASRLDMREHIFGEYSVPQIINNMSSFDYYYHIVEYSQELPDDRKLKLFEICDRHERIVPVLSGQRNSEIDRIVNSAATDCSEIGIFKLDDDDVISDEYIANASKYVDHKFKNFVVSFPKGVTGWWNSDSASYSILKRVYQPKINIGLMTICSVKKIESGTRSVQFFNIGPHTTCDERYPVIMDASFISYLWTRSGIQDTAIKKNNFDEHTLKKLSRLSDIELSDIEGFSFLSPCF
jgi:hypothetical protein